MPVTKTVLARRKIGLADHHIKDQIVPQAMGDEACDHLVQCALAYRMSVEFLF